MSIPSLQLPLSSSASEPSEDSALAVGYSTDFGQMLVGSTDRATLEDEFLRKCAGRVQLIFTSPPFPLIRKKSYDNLRGEDYVEWLAALAPLLKPVPDRHRIRPRRDRQRLGARSAGMSTLARK